VKPRYLLEQPNAEHQWKGTPLVEQLNPILPGRRVIVAQFGQLKDVQAISRHSSKEVIGWPKT
jgi:hypothetical protein